jgi:hypothetical protein
MGTAEGSEDTADTIIAAKTASTTPAIEPVGVAPGMHDVHDDSHHPDHNTVEASDGDDDHEECDGACDICGEHHPDAQRPSNTRPKGSSLGALLSALAMMGGGGGMPEPETREQKADRLLDDLCNSATRRVSSLISVAAGAMEDVGRVISVLPADDRDEVLKQLKEWIKNTEEQLPALRAQDVAKGRAPKAINLAKKNTDATDATV